MIWCFLFDNFFLQIRDSKIVSRKMLDSDKIGYLSGIGYVELGLLQGHII